MSRIFFVSALLPTLCFYSANSALANSDIERIQVTAGKNLTQQKSNFNIKNTINVEDSDFSLQKVSDALLFTPGVSLNGQGGLFQSYNIRGLARWRVKSLVDGVNINTDRRAGNSLSFIDPNLLSNVDVISGPSSVYYGSGAIGGVINANLKRSDFTLLSAGYNSFGNENHLSVTTKINDDLYAGIAYRHANNGESQQQQPLLSKFEQYSAYLTQTLNIFDNIRLDSSLIGSYGNDIGKTNNQYPNSRISTYPFEKHLLGKVTISEIEHWAAGIYFHDQKWQSDTTRINKRRNINDYRSFDWGLYSQKNWQLNSIDGRIGLDIDNRSNVEITEKQYTTADQFQWRKIILEGNEYRGALYGDTNFDLSTTKITAGARLEYVKQTNQTNVSDKFATGFIKFTAPLSDYSTLNVDLGTGFRFPTLTERFFNGSTARTQIVGNKNLSPEKSKNALISYQISTEKLKLQLNGFYNHIDNYIERVAINANTLTYRNETTGIIYGGEFELNTQLTDNFSLHWIYQLAKGQNKLQQPLADVPPVESRLLLTWSEDNWQINSNYRYRSNFKTPASGEQVLNAAHIIDLSGHYWLTHSFKLTVAIKNLGDENYIATTDDNASIMPGRQWSLTGSWEF